MKILLLWAALFFEDGQTQTNGRQTDRETWCYCPFQILVFLAHPDYSGRFAQTYLREYFTWWWRHTDRTMSTLAANTTYFILINLLHSEYLLIAAAICE
jgi:hypothetical protein